MYKALYEANQRLKAFDNYVWDGELKMFLATGAGFRVFFKPKDFEEIESEGIFKKSFQINGKELFEFFKTSGKTITSEGYNFVGQDGVVYSTLPILNRTINRDNAKLFNESFKKFDSDITVDWQSKLYVNGDKTDSHLLASEISDTIKVQSAKVNHTLACVNIIEDPEDSEEYVFNLVDTFTNLDIHKLHFVCTKDIFIKFKCLKKDVETFSLKVSSDKSKLLMQYGVNETIYICLYGILIIPE